MKETYGLEQSIEEICTGVMSGIEFAYRDCIQCKPGVVDMLESMRAAGVAMCVATATRRDCALAALERLDILKYFSALFTCTEVGASKTEPDIFELALSHLAPRAKPRLCSKIRCTPSKRRMRLPSP